MAKMLALKNFYFSVFHQNNFYSSIVRIIWRRLSFKLYELYNIYFCHIELNACLILEIKKYSLGPEFSHFLTLCMNLLTTYMGHLCFPLDLLALLVYLIPRQ